MNNIFNLSDTIMINKHNKIIRIILATLLGDVLVWYDYALYGELVNIFSIVFFPETSQWVGIMWAFLVFAIGFIVRPIGALIFGFIGDKKGRKSALMLSIILITTSVLIIISIPTYHTLGILSTILLTFARIIQGIAIGGESGNAVFLLESADKEYSKYRGFISSFQVVSAILGALLSILALNLCNAFISYENFVSWGWKIPFIAGLFIGIIGMIVRYKLQSDAPIKKDTNFNPITHMFKNYKKNVIIAIGADSVEECTLYIFLVFFSLIVTTDIGIAKFFLTLLLAVLTMYAAFLGDKLGTKTVMFYSFFALLFLAYPIFLYVTTGSYKEILIAEIAFVAIIASSIGPINVFMCDLFPQKIRYTCFAFSRNISAGLFGGLAPLICSFIINYTDNIQAPSLYLILCALIGIISLSASKKKSL